jgi:prevent-host-death family protein
MPVLTARSLNAADATFGLPVNLTPFSKWALHPTPFVTRILVMETLPLATVKAQLSNLVDRVEDTHDRVLITRNGKPAAILISPEDLESLEETLEILSDPAAMKRIRKAQREVERGDVVTEEQLRELVAARSARAEG